MIDVIVFTYNNEDIIDKCLRSVRKQSYKNFSCTVVDDDSDDKTVEIIRKRYPWVKIVRKEKNTGPTESRNIGIRKTKNKFIAMLDSDVELSKDWLKEQMKLMKDETTGIVGSKLLFPNGKINSAGGCITRLGFGFDRKSSDQEQVSYLCSAAWLMKRMVADRIGFFDKAYFYPHEDTDFCWRASLAGFKLIYNPKATAIHMSGKTTKKMAKRVAFHVTKNRIRSILKNYEFKNILKYLPLHIILVFFDILFRGNRLAKARGLTWNIMNIGDTMKRRKEVQSTRKVSDKDVMKLFSNKWVNEKF